MTGCKAQNYTPHSKARRANNILSSSKVHFNTDARAVKVHLEGDLGDVDIFPSPDTACVYLPESDVINVTASVQARLAALAKVG